MAEIITFFDANGYEWQYDLSENWVKVVGDDTEGGGYPADDLQDALEMVKEMGYMDSAPRPLIIIPTENERILSKAYDGLYVFAQRVLVETVRYKTGKLSDLCALALDIIGTDDVRRAKDVRVTQETQDG